MVSFRACKRRLICRLPYRQYSIPGTASLVNVTVNMRFKWTKNIKFVITRFDFFKLKMHQNRSQLDPSGELSRLSRTP